MQNKTCYFSTCGQHIWIWKNKWKLKKFYQSQVSILGPVGYGPTTLPLRHFDFDVLEVIDVFMSLDLLFGADHIKHYLVHKHKV